MKLITIFVKPHHWESYDKREESPNKKLTPFVTLLIPREGL